ncbi:MAG: arginine--tRNA ligase [Ruminococcus sp.]|nr:arginine--tRNA ligase [Ruminococcus sp.]
MDCIKQASETLRQLLLDGLGQLVAAEKIPAVPIPSFQVEIPADKAHGDFAANVVLVSAKVFRMAPKKIAVLLLEAVPLEGTIFERAEVAGPGFLNFFLKQQWFADVVQTVLTEKEQYGKTQTGCGKRVLVEFVSANPTGPMHIGNARGGALGDSLAEILSWTGWNVEREFYVNDAGNQIEKFATSLEVRYLQHFDSSVEMPEDAYQGADIVEYAENFIAEHGDAYVQTDAKKRRDALVAYALPQNIAGLERDLKKYRIVYDNWFRESTLHQNGRVQWVIDELTRRGCTYEKEGAIWFQAEQFGADKDFVLVRANGIPTYVVPDIAYHYDKLMVRNFDKAIDILGADHHGYVPRLKAALKALGVDTDRLDVVLMQMVMLMRDGEAIKLSKRSGKAITLVTLLDEIPLDAARFFFNTREANSHFEFDLDLAVEKSSQNPVYYVQYAHARICSLMRTMAEEGLTQEQCDAKNLTLLTHPTEIELIRHLATLPSELDTAARQYDPSRVTKYVVELATMFHRFYDACSMKYAETSEIQQARLLLSGAVCQVISNCLRILKVTCPEKM